MTRPQERLIAEIEEFTAETGMGETYFGAKAVGNSALLKRLRKGGRVWPETTFAVREFMANERAKRSGVAS